MKYFFSLIALFICCSSTAQDYVPVFYLSTDIVYDAESIPNLSYEHFFIKNEKLKSWRINAGYQVHYNDSFGIVTTRHGDKVSVGVYQGPAASFGYTVYSSKHRKKWNNYFSTGLCVKYLWYDSTAVLTSKDNTESYRIQSEKCFAAVPQFSIGAKRIKKNFCADFFIGFQLPVKYRYKTIIYDQESNVSVNQAVPYHITQIMAEPGLLAGIKLGYIKVKRVPATPASTGKN